MIKIQRIRRYKEGPFDTGNTEDGKELRRSEFSPESPMEALRELIMDQLYFGTSIIDIQNTCVFVRLRLPNKYMYDISIFRGTENEMGLLCRVSYLYALRYPKWSGFQETVFRIHSDSPFAKDLAASLKRLREFNHLFHIKLNLLLMLALDFNEDDIETGLTITVDRLVSAIMIMSKEGVLFQEALARTK